MEVDYLAVSFPRDAADMEYARQLRDEAGGTAWLVAKIERAEAVADDETLDGLIKASDAVMVARGDLGVEIGDAELIGIQKKIILHARRHNKAVIVATQMMESMIQNPMPTRAEVSDVANAVLDYTDAVMLSAESAAGPTRWKPCRPWRVSASVPKSTRPARPPATASATFRALRREHRPGGHVHRQPLPGREGDHRPDRKWLHPADHVAHPFLGADLCVHPAPRSPGSRRHVPWRVHHPVRPGIAGTERSQPEGYRRVGQAWRRREGDWVILTKGDSYHTTGGTNGMKILHVGDPQV
jgi:pyruvate kinase